MGDDVSACVRCRLSIWIIICEQAAITINLIVDILRFLSGLPIHGSCSTKFNMYFLIN